MIRVLSRLILTGGLIFSPGALGQLALFTVAELAEKADTICLCRALAIETHGWRDEHGRDIQLAIMGVVTPIKRAESSKIAIAFKPGVSEQTKFVSERRYIIFALENHGGLMLGHQLVALPIDGDIVSMTGLRSEPERQSVADLVRRLNLIVHRK
jgi:hypothetical protein